MAIAYSLPPPYLAESRQFPESRKSVSCQFQMTDLQVYGVAVGEGVKKYSLGAGGVEI
jgi:hypothetical protein